MKLWHNCLLVLFLLVGAPVAMASTPTMTGTINVNTASRAELMLLPGIGETRADAIISLRQKNPFRRIEDLLAVKGIGDGLLKKIAPYVVLSGATTITKDISPEASKP